MTHHPSMRAFKRSFGTALLCGAFLGAHAVAQAASPKPPAPAPESAAAQPGLSYVTVAGDTLDRIVKKAMADSPLKEELLRQALMQANPKVFTAGAKTRLKPGTTLALPDHQALLRQILLPVLDAREAGAYFPPPPTSQEERRRWVRYP